MSHVLKVKTIGLELLGASIGMGRLALVLLSLTMIGHAQTATTSIRGDVTDPTGAVVANVDVTINETSIGFTQAHVTDEKGASSFQQIPPGPI